MSETEVKQDVTTTTTPTGDSSKQTETTQQQPSIEIVSNGQQLQNPTENANSPEAEKTQTDEAQQTTEEVEVLQKGVDDRKQAAEEAKKVLADRNINFDSLQQEYDEKG